MKPHIQDHFDDMDDDYFQDLVERNLQDITLAGDWSKEELFEKLAYSFLMQPQVEDLLEQDYEESCSILNDQNNYVWGQL
jgi:hypothetical protein